MGLLFAGLVEWVKRDGHTAGDEAIFAKAMVWVPFYYAATILVLVLAGARILKRHPAPASLRR